MLLDLICAGILIAFFGATFALVGLCATLAGDGR